MTTTRNFLRRVVSQRCRPASAAVLALALALAVTVATGSAPAADAPKLPGEDGRTYKPPTIKGAVHTRVAHLPGRDWERLDIWVPENPPESAMPCLVNVYGGGWAGKVTGLGYVTPLLAEGWVVAQPDVVLGGGGIYGIDLMSCWDVADAVRYLREHAATYKIDPERIGVAGWSAGGWRVQYGFYPTQALRNRPYDAKDTTFFRVAQPRLDADGNPVMDPRRNRPQTDPHPLVRLDLHPAVAPDQSYFVQGAVSDWGAGRLWDKRDKKLVDWVDPNAPPLLTLYGPQDELYRKAGVPQGDAVVNPITGLKALGIPARGLYDCPRNTHVPNVKTSVVTEQGEASTWGAEIFRFLNDTVKHPTEATPPQICPPGAWIAVPTAVRVLTIHPTGVIHYTLDGSQPTAESAQAKGTVTVHPGQTLKAIVIRDGLKPSRVSEAWFHEGNAPRIELLPPVVQIAEGKEVDLQPRATHAEGVRWCLGGIQDGLRCDPSTGRVTGKPSLPIAYPVVLWCYRVVEGPTGQAVQMDMQRLVIVPASVKLATN